MRTGLVTRSRRQVCAIRWIAITATVITTLTGSQVWCLELSKEEMSQVKPALEGQVADLLFRYQVWDHHYKDGKGNSDAKTSGGLGWGEASFLRDYIYNYWTSTDTYWLDKVIDHFDRMIANMRENPDGFMAWDDPAYSVGVIEAKAVGDVGEATIEPELQRPHVRRGQPNVTGHTYEILFPSTDRYLVRDATTGEEVATGQYTGEAAIEAITRAKLTIKGAVKPGAKFEVRTHAPERCEYQVHDGMVTYRIAQFIETVLTSNGLDQKYTDKAKEYLGILDRDFLQKWEGAWADLPHGAGLYKFTKNPTQRFPDTSLPHNQYLALARTWLVLADLPGYGNATLCRQRAAAMAIYFKQNLRLVEGAYDWHYWDPLPQEDVGRHTEDYSHATIDIGFAVQAAARGIVFEEEDLRRFARTYVDVMWNGDKDKPRFGGRVNTNEGDKVAWADWVELCMADLRVWEVGLALFNDQGRPTGMIPTMLHIYDQLVGIDEAERAACRNATARLAKLELELLPNSDFELGDGHQPLLWSLTTWGPDSGESEVKWVRGGHTGERAIALIGKGEKVNALVYSQKRIPAGGHAAVEVSAWYRTEASPRPHFSIIGYDANGEKAQYDSCPSFEASADWRQGKHEFKLKPEVVDFDVFLRNGAPGTVWYDDAGVKLIP